MACLSLMALPLSSYLGRFLARVEGGACHGRAGAQGGQGLAEAAQQGGQGGGAGQHGGRESRERGVTE